MDKKTEECSCWLLVAGCGRADKLLKWLNGLDNVFKFYYTLDKYNGSQGNNMDAKMVGRPNG